MFFFLKSETTSRRQGPERSLKQQRQTPETIEMRQPLRSGEL